MQWLLSMEIENDPISLCRLMNVFRRKGVGLGTLTLSGEPDRYSLVAVVDTAESAVDHLYNFLRRTEGVRHVTCYGRQESSEASFVYIDAGQGSANLDRVLAAFPESKVVFASHGKFLLETPGEGGLKSDRPAGSEFLPLGRILSTRTTPAREPVEAVAS